MPGPERVSVVIPTRDGAATLGEVLERLRAQRASFEVETLLVDSGSSDGTLAIARRYPVRVHAIDPSEFNHGETRNLGIQLVGGDPVVLLTQDAVPASDDFLANLVRPFEDPRVAGVFGRQVPRADCDAVTRRQLEAWVTGRTRPDVVRLAEGELDRHPPEARHRLCAFDNVCSAVRRSTWEAIPFPRADFAEDLAWSKAVLLAGWAIAYEPSAAVVHSHRRSIGDEYRRTRLCHRRLQQIFGLSTLPRRRYAVRAAFANLRSDLPFVWRDVPRHTERVRQLARVAALSVASPLAQYQGARDARRAGRG